MRALFLDFDTDGSFDLGMKEFGKALTALGVRREKEVTEALFDELDYNGNYRIGFAEFKAWLVAGEKATEAFESRLAETVTAQDFDTDGDGVLEVQEMAKLDSL